MEKQINRIAKKIEVDENGNEKKEIVVKKNIRKRKDYSTLIFVLIMLVIIALLAAFISYKIVPDYIRKTTIKEKIQKEVPTYPVEYEGIIIKDITLNEGKDLNRAGEYTVNELFKINLNDNNGKFDVLVNGKKITEANGVKSIVGYVEDVLMFVTFNNADRTMKFYVVNEEGKKLKEIYELGNTPGVVLSDYAINSVGVSLVGSRVLNNKVIIKSDFGYTDGIDICDEDALKKAQITNNSLVQANYSLEYLGDQKLSELKPFYSMSLNDYKNEHNLCK